MKRSNRARSWNAWDISTALFPVLRVFWRNSIASAVEIPLENPWKCHFRDSKFQNVPRCLGPQQLVPSVRVPKPPTIHYQPEKLFDSPGFKPFAQQFPWPGKNLENGDKAWNNVKSLVVVVVVFKTAASTLWVNFFSFWSNLIQDKTMFYLESYIVLCISTLSK